ncbi:ral guanine nucleotide dissociation stimulator-like [Dasypus novemcinctus]|uniref:ral guanine nucleotide dissociation stimulator-like n=1 Tax=Dasypus novemcinctus TaxID=9361 RepID=UPI0039C9213D
MQVVGEELEEGLVYTVSLRKVPVHWGPGQGRHWFQVRGLTFQVFARLRFSVKAEDLSPLGALTAPRPDVAHGSGQQRKNEGALVRGESRTMRTVKAGRWEDLAEHLVPALQESDLSYVHTFLGTYRMFASTEHVLDQLFHCTLCALLGTWMDQYWEDFLQPPDAPCFQLLAAHAQEHLPGSGLQCCVALLLVQMTHPEPMEAEPEADTGPEPESAPSPPGVPASEVAPAPAMQIEPDAFHAMVPAPELKVAPTPPQLPPTGMGPVPSLELDHPTWPCGDGLHEQKPELLAFPPELVAEQLSLMDALFKKVVPYHCLGSIWSQCKQKGKEHVAPTVHAVIGQVNCVADCVMATCLGDHSMKATDRARVVEHWIEVARCRTLHNSLAHAILSALESHVIGHQKKTWVEVSRDSFHLFQTLSEIFSTESNSSQGSELISQEGNPEFATLDVNPNRVQQQQQQQQQEGGAIQGTVPWLGTFLTRFSMVNSAMQEFLDGTMVNFEKRRKEYQLVARLQQLQTCCCYDCLVSNGCFGAWFEAVEQLSQKDSLLLSREWEPPPESASESFQAQQPPEGSKPWSGDRQGPDAESSGSSSSTAHSSVQLQGGPDLSGGVAADSPHTPVAGSSGSEVEIHLDHLPEAQDGQEVKPGQSTCASSWVGSTVTSASEGMSSFSSIQARATWTSQKHCDSQPCYKWHVGDRCLVHVALAEDSGHMVQSILVTDQDRAPAVICKALEEHELAGEQPTDYQLVQIISGDVSESGVSGEGRGAEVGGGSTALGLRSAWKVVLLTPATVGQARQVLPSPAASLGHLQTPLTPLGLSCRSKHG